MKISYLNPLWFVASNPGNKALGYKLLYNFSVETPDNSKEHTLKEFPKIQLLIDKEQDIWKINHFLGKTSVGGTNFQRRILLTHPELKGLELLSQEERLPQVKACVDKFYEDHKTDLEQVASQTVSQWSEFAPTFFDKVDKIFKGLKWPYGEYKGYVSISGPCPRFLDSKTFQFPSDGDGVSVIAHEMFHFIFYDYVRQRYTPQLINTDEQEMNRLLHNKFSIPLWELSEVFDSVILSQFDFGKEVSIFSSGYPALRGHLTTVKRIWKDTKGDIDLFFSSIEVK